MAPLLMLLLLEVPLRKKKERRGKKRGGLNEEEALVSVDSVSALFLSLALTAFQFPPVQVFGVSTLVHERGRGRDRGRR